MRRSPSNFTEPPVLTVEAAGAADQAGTSASVFRAEPSASSRTWQMRVVWAAVLLYAAGFLCFYPEGLTNFDEVSYVRQAVSFASESATVDSIDPYTGQHQREHPSDYPVGTSALMAPLVWLAGWRGVFLLGLLGLAGCTLITARWIADSGESPLYALAVIGYLPTMVMARTGMSDLPSACLVAAGLWLFWADNQSAPWRRFGAGFLAGASICLREPVAILFAIFFAGALLRRERHVVALILGGLAGVACRPLSAALVFGNPLFVKGHVYGFSGLFARENLMMYLTGLLVLVPGGLIFAFFYRGNRWIELIATVVVYVGLFVAWDYNGAPSGGLKQWVLSLRFLIPLVPIVVFAMAHTCPRWYQGIAQSLRPEKRLTLQRVSKSVVALWVAGIVIVGFLVNWRSQQYSKLHADVVQTLYAHTDTAIPIETDVPAAVKFLNELYGPRMVADLGLGGNQTDEVRRDLVRRLLERYKTVQIVLFEREDSDYWLNKSKQDQAFIQGLEPRLNAPLKFQQRFPGLGVLRIWNVSGRS